MGGFAVHGCTTPKGPRQIIHLEPRELLELIQANTLPWPEVRDDDIAARSKADWLVKVLALVQILWFVVQMIGRAIQDLDITTLELFTQAIVLCAIVMYVLWWEKPYDVQQPIVMPATDPIPHVSTTVDGSVELIQGNTLFQRDSWWVWPSILGVCLAFGALHLVAWNFHFPSEAEKWLWRVSSLCCMTFPALITLTAALEDAECVVFPSSSFFSLALPALYFIFRVYMFVDMFASLRDAPASVYQTPEWSQYFPAFG